MEEEIELLDSQNETDADTEKSDEVVVEELDDTEKLKQTNAKLYARLKKEQEARKAAEEQLKKSSNTNQVPNQSVSREEIVLIARGYSEEELEIAQGIAKGFGIPLTDAVKHDMFITFKDKKDKESKAEKAKLGASNSSGSRRDESVKPDMSVEDHKAAWKKAMS